MLSEFKRIEMGSPAAFEDEHKLVLAPVEGTLACGRLGPDAECSSARRKLRPQPQAAHGHAANQLRNVSDAAISGVASAEAERLLQKSDELIEGHFARGALELPVLRPTTTTHVALDRNVVRRVEKRHLGSLGVHQMGVGLRITSVAHQQPMAAKNKEVSRPGRRCLRQTRNSISGVILVLGMIQEDRIDLAGVEAGDVDVQTDFRQRNLELLQLGGQ